MKTRLSPFIEHARSKGMDHQTIRMILLSSGWKERDIADALAQETLDLPVPLPPDTGSAKDAFTHLLTFTTLYSTVISLIVLFFTFLDRLLPDAAFPRYAYADDFSGIRWPLAVLIVSFPLLLWMSKLLHRSFTAHTERLLSPVRRWLTYITLFITACTLMGDLITLVFFLLQGELTLRFLLKVTTILVLCGTPFLYYLRTIRMEPDAFARTRLHRGYLLCGGVIVLVAIVWSLLIVGSPLYGRSQRFDDVRLADLHAIREGILAIVYGQARYAPAPQIIGAMPRSLDEIQSSVTSQRLSIVDPQTGTPYEYILSGGTRYQLCAIFALPRNAEYDLQWNHPGGRACFTLDAANLIDGIIPK